VGSWTKIKNDKPGMNAELKNIYKLAPSFNSGISLILYPNK